MRTMFHGSPAFDAWVEPARGRPQAWRLVAGVILTLVAWFAGATALLGAWPAFVWMTGGDVAEAVEGMRSVVEGGSPSDTVLALLTFGGLWVGLWMAARWLHRRRFRSIVAPTLALDWRQFAQGVALAGIFIGAGTLPILALGIVPARSELDIATWLIWLLPIVGAVVVQATAEELLFRGYLTQQIAAAARTPLAWAVLPSLLFGFAHFNPALGGLVPIGYVLTTFITGLTLTLLVWRTGSLASAIGFHIAVNVVGLTVTGAADLGHGTPLFVYPEGMIETLIWIDVAASAALLGWLWSPYCPGWARRRVVLPA